MAAALVIAAQAHAGLDLINNGDFDNTAGTFKANNGDAGAMKLLGTSASLLPGWSVIVPKAPSGSPPVNISWDSGANPYGLTASQGQYFLDLTGWTDGKNGQYGGVSQVVQHTVAGQQYQLTFDLGSSTAYDPYAPGVRVSINGILRGTDFANVSTANNWQQETLTFTATGPTTSLLLSGVSQGGQIKYIGLDNVHLTAVPESTTFFAGAGALGLVVLGVLRSKRSGVIRIG